MMRLICFNIHPPRLLLTVFLGMTAITPLLPTLAQTPQPTPSQPAQQTTQPTPTARRFEGEVEKYLLNREGIVDGLLLNNGAQVKFPPRVGDQLGTMAKPGALIQAQGIGIRNDYGQVLEASALTIDSQAIDMPNSSKEPKEKRPSRPAPNASDKPAPTNPGAIRVMPRPSLPLN